MSDFLYDVSRQIRAIELMEPVHTFLYDTFVQNEGAILEEDAHYDFMKGETEMAPFVVNGAGGKEMPRDRFETRGLTFPTIAPERTLEYMDYSKNRMFAEEITGAKSPQDRMKALLAKDIAYLRRTIQMRREWMAAEVLFKGRLSILEYLEGGTVVQATKCADYSFTNTFTPVKKWSESGANIADDLQLMFDMVAQGQGTSRMAVFGTDVRSALTNDETFMKRLDIRHAMFGEIRQGEWHNALQYVGSTPQGVELYCYDGKFRETKGGPRKSFVPEGSILIGDKKLLRCMHGPVAQVEKEGELPKIYAKEEVPFRYTKTGGNSVMQRLTSRPMILPYNVDAWVVGKVL